MAMASPSSGRCCLQRLLAVSAPSTSLLRALPACSSAPSDDAAYCRAHGAPATFRRGSRGSSHLEPDPRGGISLDGHGFMWEVCWNSNPTACRRFSFFPGNGHGPDLLRSSTFTNSSRDHLSAGLGTNQGLTGRRKEPGLQMLDGTIHMQELKTSTQLAKHRCFASQVFSRDFDSDSSSESDGEGSYRALKDKKKYDEKYMKKLYMQKWKQKDARLQESLAILQERNKRLQASLDTAQKSSGTTNIMLLGLGCMQGGVAWWLYHVDPVVATKLLEELSSNPALAQTLAISPSLLGLARIMLAFLRGGGGGDVETS